MSEQKSLSCAAPAGGPIQEPETVNAEPAAAPERRQQAMIQVGKKAPDFRAPSYLDGQFSEVRLSQFLGQWVVLCFYPGDFTFVCATEVSAMAEKYDEFRKLGVQVLSLSTDSVFVHKMWVDHELSKMVTAGALPFPMLSDAGGRIGQAYGVYDEEAGVDVRGRFLIDPDGIVQGFEVLAPPVGRRVLETLRQIKAFQLVRENNGAIATPAGWAPGTAVLKPGPDLVGNVWKEWKVGMAFAS